VADDNRIPEEVLKMNDNLLQMREELNEFKTQIKDLVLSSEDKIMGELKDIREQQIFFVGYRDMISRSAL